MTVHYPTVSRAVSRTASAACSRSPTTRRPARRTASAAGSASSSARPQVIKVEMLKAEKRNFAKTFTLELYACEFCELCVQVCPTDAIIMMKSFDLATTDRREMLLDKDRLHAHRPAVRAVVGDRQPAARHAGAAEGGAPRQGARRSRGAGPSRSRSRPSDARDRRVLGRRASVLAGRAASRVVLTQNLFHSVLWLALALTARRRASSCARRRVPRRRAAPALRGRRRHHRGLRDRASPSGWWASRITQTSRQHRGGALRRGRRARRLIAGRSSPGAARGAAPAAAGDLTRAIGPGAARRASCCRSSCWRCCCSPPCSARSTSRGRRTSLMGRSQRLSRPWPPCVLLHRPVRRAHAAREHHRHPARHRADAERGQHQPGRLRPLPRRRRRAWSSPSSRSASRWPRSALGLAIVILLFRVRRTVDGGPPGPAEGLMTARAAASRAHRAWPAALSSSFLCWPSCRRCAARRRPAAWLSIAALARPSLVGRGLRLARVGAGDGADASRLDRVAVAPVGRPGRSPRWACCVDATPAVDAAASSRSWRCLVQVYSLGYLHDEPPAVARPLLRLPVALRVLDDGARARAELPAALHLLGAGRPLLVPADRLLVPAARRRRARR